MILVKVAGKGPALCIDYHDLSANKKDHVCLIPDMEDGIEQVSGANYISTLNLVRKYWQGPMTARRPAAVSVKVRSICYTLTIRVLWLDVGRTYLRDAPKDIYFLNAKF